MLKKNGRKEKFFITTAIAYVNGKPHIGHALEVIQADAIARYMRVANYDVFFGTGTDEHGDKIRRVALQNKKTTRQFVNEISAVFKSQKKALNLSYDKFIRTSSKKEHWVGVYKLWAELEKRGDIYKKKYEGLYCVGCETFLTEKDLINGKCLLHQKAPEKIEEENYFFRLTKYARAVEKVIASDALKILPATRKNEALTFIRDGLEDVSFSRLKKVVPWGIPIPKSDQTMYVWCDALSNYLSIVGYGQNTKTFKKWWPADTHIIGKDILRFHAIYWPAMLLSAGLPLPKAIMAHGFITSEGQKMSKTLGNVVNPFEAAEKYGVDALRYYLLREIPSDGDGDFSWGKFKNRYNDDLAKGLGNFVSRTTHLLSGEKISVKLPISRDIQQEIRRMNARIEKHITEFRLHDALAAIFQLIQFGDGYINEKQPWKNKNAKVSRNLSALVIATGQALLPFMPETAEKILAIFPIKAGYICPKKSKALFPRAE